MGSPDVPITKQLQHRYREQIQGRLFCGSQLPTLSAPLTTCAPSQYGSTLIKIPAPGTENDGHNPPRIAPRHLFDVAISEDNLFHGVKYQLERAAHRN